MAFHPFEVNAVHLAYTLLGGFVVIFGMLSLIIKEKLYIGEAPIAVVIGIIIGPHALDLFSPRGWGGGASSTANEITLEVTRVVIAISVFAVGVELPKAYMKKHWRSLAFLLGPCMLYGWMVSALLIWGLTPGLTFLSSLVIAAAVTPTDPILAQAVIGGAFADKHVPAHIRHMLSAESGSNDGAAFPFLGIALYLTLDASPGHAVGEWFYYTIAYEIILGTFLGALLGFTARKVMKFAERKKLIDRQSFVAQYVALAIMSIGVGTLLGSDDLLAAFACGTAFAWDGFFNKATEDAVFSNVIDLLFNCAAFIYIGAIIPFDSFNNSSIGLHVWRLVVLAILILLVRRLPVIFALYRFIPDIKTFREAAFTGWFGPMGVGAIFIGTLAVTSLPEGDIEGDTEQVDLLRQTLLPIVSFLVLSSVITHGMSIPFFSLGRRVHSITYTWSRNPSMDTRRDDEPAWTTHARRIQPGQEIVINRDEDPVEGDLGIRGEKTSESQTEKQANPPSPEDESGGSSSSRTVAPDEAIVTTEKRRESDARSSDDEQSVEEIREEAEGREVLEDEDEERVGGGGQTPPLAQYREGHHLIKEWKRGDGEEVEVEVIRNHFHDDKPSENATFSHPHPLKHKEVDQLTKHLPLSVDHAVSHVEDYGKNAIDRLGLGLMTSHLSSDAASSAASIQSSPGRRPREVEAEPPPEADTRNGEEDVFEEDEEETAGTFSGRRGSMVALKRLKSPTLSISSGKDRGRGIREKLFGRRRSSPSSPSSIEEGRAQTNPDFIKPSTPASQPRPIPTIVEPEDDNDRTLSLSRTTSIPRNTSVRFAADSSLSSEVAPGRSNYGANAPGFKKNPALAMSRSTSVNSAGESPSVSFQEPVAIR